MRLDHLVITGPTLESAADWVETRLGVPLQPGGSHAHFGTHNRLLGLGRTQYLEAIAIDPSAPKPAVTRWYDLDRRSADTRLSMWACAVDDLDAATKALPEAGEIVALSRGDLNWRMAVPKSGTLPYDNCFPALIEWTGPLHPARLLTGQGASLDTLTVSHPEAGALQRRLAEYLTEPAIRFVTGEAGLSAHLSTPSGSRVL